MFLYSVLEGTHYPATTGKKRCQSHHIELPVTGTAGTLTGLEIQSQCWLSFPFPLLSNHSICRHNLLTWYPVTLNYGGGWGQAGAPSQGYIETLRGVNGGWLGSSCYFLKMQPWHSSSQIYPVGLKVPSNWAPIFSKINWEPIMKKFDYHYQSAQFFVSKNKQELKCRQLMSVSSSWDCALATNLNILD